MAAPKLTTEQKVLLLQLLAAEYSGQLIRKWFIDREWPGLSDATLSYYREKWASDIEAARVDRRGAALNSGLALKEERVKRLVDHADELEAIKWLPDDKGRLWNEKAWRETLDDIAKEMGHRKAGVELTGKNGGPIEIDDARNQLAAALSDALARRNTIGADSGDSSASPGDSDRAAQ